MREAEAAVMSDSIKMRLAGDGRDSNRKVDSAHVISGLSVEAGCKVGINCQPPQSGQLVAITLERAGLGIGLINQFVNTAWLPLPLPLPPPWMPLSWLRGSGLL